MELKFEAPRENELLALEKCNVNGKDESIPVRTKYPPHPVPVFDAKDFSFAKVDKFALEKAVKIAKSRANDIIIRDPDPQWVSAAFFDKYDELEPILAKDSVQCFLRLLENCAGRGMAWNLSITTQTLTFIVSFNALRCAKVVLEGKVPELHGMHANPNCINKYGYFALHEAAERFSVDMIKLLLRHGASANVRTVGDDVIENLLPLHVAVENTCLHKYLEDNLSSSQNQLDYIYKLILLLCLPEMKIFLDTTRLLAEKTNNLLKELWNYIEDGKLIQSAVLLLAAQGKICRGSSSKINGSSKKNGFDIIKNCIMRLSFSLRLEKGSHGMAQELLEERKTLIDCAWLLVDVISHSGEDLSAYIQTHSEVSHVEVFQHVSSILKEYGFRPTGDSMDTIKLRPYDYRKSDGASCEDANMAVMETANLDAAKKKKAEWTSSSLIGGTTNIILNSDFSEGLLSWHPICCHTYVASQWSGFLDGIRGNSGENYAVVTKRTEYWQGLEQDITDRVSTGIAYAVLAYVRVDGNIPGKADVKATLRLQNQDESTHYSSVGRVLASKEKWEKLEGSFSLTNMPKCVVFYLEGPPAGTDLIIDSVTIARSEREQSKAVRKKVGGGWDPTYAKISFFPYWRSVLQARFPLKVYPAYASGNSWSGPKPGQRCDSLHKPMANGSTPIPNHTLSSVQRMSPPRSNNQPRRCFITAATGAFRLLKVLK